MADVQAFNRAKELLREVEAVAQDVQNEVQAMEAAIKSVESCLKSISKLRSDMNQYVEEMRRANRESGEMEIMVHDCAKKWIPLEREVLQLSRKYAGFFPEHQSNKTQWRILSQTLEAPSFEPPLPVNPLTNTALWDKMAQQHQLVGELFMEMDRMVRENRAATGQLDVPKQEEPVTVRKQNKATQGDNHG